MFEIDPTIAGAGRDGLNKADAIRRLNDTFRRTFASGRVVLTPGVQALGAADQRALFHAVRTFEAFSPENDPYEEHDFAAVRHDGTRYFWKIDYYGLDLSQASPDPSDPAFGALILAVLSFVARRKGQRAQGTPSGGEVSR